MQKQRPPSPPSPPLQCCIFIYPRVGWIHRCLPPSMERARCRLPFDSSPEGAGRRLAPPSHIHLRQKTALEGSSPFPRPPLSSQSSRSTSGPLWPVFCRTSFRRVALRMRVGGGGGGPRLLCPHVGDISHPPPIECITGPAYSAVHPFAKLDMNGRCRPRIHTRAASNSVCGPPSPPSLFPRRQGTAFAWRSCSSNARWTPPLPLPLPPSSSGGRARSFAWRS